MLTALVTFSSLALLATACATLWRMVADDLPKIAAALRGRSLLSEAALRTRPITVRYLPTQLPSRVPLRSAATLRAAA